MDGSDHPAALPLNARPPPDHAPPPGATRRKASGTGSSRSARCCRPPRDLGATIRDRRRRRGWSQRELAEKVGASRQWVNEVEKGKTRTEVGLALRALDALDVTLRLDRDDRAHDEDDSLDIDSIDIDEIVDNARGKG